ncbi:MAG: GNAT family N-acetyltransferase [Chitinophagaceae bacterium]|nr:GNAT family N-acetyltransferase [Chitinophagaceae bacterium]
MEITIRKIKPTDVAVLSAIAKQTFYDTFVDTCTAEDMQGFLAENYSEEVLLKEILDDDNLYFFAEADDKPVGYLMFKEDYTHFLEVQQWKALELKRIYVLSQFQGKGVAQQLMDYFLSYANKNNYETVFLGVWENNFKAQRFYEKYGFTNSGYTHNFPIGNTPQTDNWYWKFLQ